MMRFEFVAAAACLFVAAAVCWNMATVAALRSLGIELSFSLPFHLFRRKTPEVLNALRDRAINTYVAVSGLLLFACPLFAGLLAYDYAVRRYGQHSPYDLTYVFASLGWLVLLVIVGVRVSISHWQKRAETGIGAAVLAILVLKVTTDLAGALTTVFLVAIVVGCAFVYVGGRRIKGAIDGRQYPARRDMPLQRNFVSEPFVPTENPTAKKVAMVQKLMASGVPVGLPSNEQRDDEER